MKQPLSRRELEVLKLAANGYTHLQIGLELHIQQQTVKNHIRAIGHKLGVKDQNSDPKSRMSLIKIINKALELGILKLEEIGQNRQYIKVFDELPISKTYRKEIEALRLFLQHGTYLAAAKAAGVTPSTFAQRIYYLEARFEQILQRNERGFRIPKLNSWGKEWLERVNEEKSVH